MGMGKVREAEGADERRCVHMFTDRLANDAGMLDSFNGCIEGCLGTDGYRVARRAARRRFGLDAGQIQPDDILSGFYVSMPRRAIGVLSLGEKRQAYGVDIELLRAR